MIKIEGNKLDVNTIIDQYKSNSIEAYILNKMSSGEEVYEYDSLDELKFEINLRKNIVDAAIDLNKSDFDFAVFRKSTANPEYWDRTPQGGFLLRNGVSASSAINDIYKNSHKYATECATAMVIVYYKAVLDSFGAKLFDEVFSNIYLMNWHYIDRNLGLDVSDDISDFLPGDCRYFKNPDVNPLTPEWQGENVIQLGNGKFYGHGIGIKTADEIIESLNEERFMGARRSAFLVDSATRPDFKHLYYIYSKYNSRSTESDHRKKHRHH